MSSTVQRASLISGLRDLADFLESNPDLPLLEGSSTGGTQVAAGFIRDKDEFLKCGPLMTDAVREDERTSIDDYLILKKFFGPLTYRLWTPKRIAGETRVEVKPVEIFKYPDFVPGGAR